MMNLDDFLAMERFPTNSYIEHPDFESLYIRRGTVGVAMNGCYYKCSKTVTLANVVAKQRGKGVFTKLVNYLVERGWAVYVENVQESKFRVKLEQFGMIPVNMSSGFHYLYNFEGHLEEFID